jgi:hypothetical protein
LGQSGGATGEVVRVWRGGGMGGLGFVVRNGLLFEMVCCSKWIVVVVVIVVVVIVVVVIVFVLVVIVVVVVVVITIAIQCLKYENKK